MHTLFGINLFTLLKKNVQLVGHRLPELLLRLILLNESENIFGEGSGVRVTAIFRNNN